MTASADSIGLAGSIRLLLRYAAPKRRAFCVVVLLSLLDAALSAQISLSFKFLIDGAITQRSGKVLALIMIGLSVSIVVVGAAGIWRDRLYGRAAGELSSGMRTRMFRHIQKLSANFYSRMPPADIVSRFSNDLTEVEAAFMSAVPYAILPALDILLSIVLIFMLDWRLAIPALAAFPVAMAGPRWLSSKTSTASYECKKHEAQIVANIQENVSAQALVRAFNLEEFARLYFDTHNRALEKIASRLGYLTLLMERSATFATQLLHVAVLGIGGYLTFRGEMTIGTLAAFQALFGTLAESLGYIAEYMPEIVRASGGMIRIEEILGEKPMVVDKEDTVQLRSFGGAIEFQNVGFGYDANHRNLDGLSLKITHGTSVALVGKSGSGKSTVLSLLMRFYDPVDGAVRIDGLDLRTVSQESLRSKMSMVFQENVLFNATIRENIRMAKPQATDEEIEQAAQKAGLHEFIGNLPDAYDTVLAAGDGRFPAGQRQRVAIARALLREPEILILDDATSALDSGSEAQINETIRHAAQGRTVISATHRLASVIGADRIFLLDKGAVVEEGTHVELLDRDALYAGMWKRQSGFLVSSDGIQAQATPEWLRGVPVLSQIDEATLAKLSTMFTTERYSKGDFIIHEGAIGDKFYILVRGIVEVLKSTPQGFQRLKLLQDGDHFGETSMIMNAPRNASIRALAECTLLVLDRERFLALMERVPTLRWKLREEALIKAFQTEAEAAEALPETAEGKKTARALRHDLFNLINQISGYCEMAAEDLQDGGHSEEAGLARRVHAQAEQVRAGIERAIPAQETITGDRLEVLRGQIHDPLLRLQEAASALQAATAGSNFIQLHQDVAKIVAACQRMGGIISGSAPDSSLEVQGPSVEDAEVIPFQTVEPPETGRKWHLLVVDDNDFGRSLLCRKLERQGYRASGAASGAQALKMIQESEFDLVLLDVMMPDLDGYAVLDRLKQMGRLDRLPVIMTTALDDIKSLTKCLDMGAEDYLTKPYNPLLLRSRLALALERKRARDKDGRAVEQMRAALSEMEERCRSLEARVAANETGEVPPG